LSLKDYPWLIQTLARLPQALPDALLIHGQSGIGKQQLASALAQSLLCADSVGPGKPCGRCAACHLFDVGNHVDYRLIQPESETEEGARVGSAKAGKGKRPSVRIRVDDIRGLADLVTKASHMGGAKVVVVAPADTLQPNAGNALLKMLEEPNKDTYFILVANAIHKILPTISSRCFKLAVSPPSPADAVTWLSSRASNHVDESLRLSSHAPIAALKLSEDNEFWSCRDELMAGFGESTPDPLRLAAGAERLEPEDVGRLLGMWLYDLLATQAGGEIRYHADMGSVIKRTAAQVSGADLCDWSDEVRDYTRAASHPLNKRLALEALFASWPGSQHA
jgi:DNA polymerase-3 subunit delta'